MTKNNQQEKFSNNKRIDLSSSKWKEELQDLKTNTTLTKLTISDSDTIGPEAAMLIADVVKFNTALRGLDLSNASISSEALIYILEVIKTNTAVRGLNLSNDYISPAAAKVIADILKRNTTLTELDLSGTSITPEGIEAIADALKTNTTLKKLDLSNNFITPEGIEAIADALDNNITLTTLNLSGTSMRNEGANLILKALMGGCPSLKELNLDNNCISEELVNKLKAIQNILILTSGQLNMDGGTISSDSDSDSENKWDDIPELVGEEKDDIAAPKLNHVKDEGANTAVVKKNPILTDLDLSGTSITPEGIEAIADAVKTNTARIKLNNLPSTIDKKTAELIADTLIAEKIIAKTLNKNPILKKLDLSNRNMVLDAAKDIADALKINTVRIKFNNITINQEEAKVIADAVKTNTTLQVLDLSNCSIMPPALIHILEVLKTNRTLTKLILSNVYITPEAAKVIANVVKLNPALTDLDLSGTSITPKGIEVIADVLKTNKTLKTLDLSRCNSIDSARIPAEVIADVLKTNKTLQVLNLSYLKINPEGIKLILEAVKTNPAMTDLKLSDCKITQEAAEVIADVLKTNTTLKKLDLSNNQLNDKVVQLIIDFLMSCSLKELNLDNNCISEELVNKLKGITGIKILTYYQRYTPVEGTDKSWNDGWWMAYEEEEEDLYGNPREDSDGWGHCVGEDSDEEDSDEEDSDGEDSYHDMPELIDGPIDTTLTGQDSHYYY